MLPTELKMHRVAAVEAWGDKARWNDGVLYTGLHASEELDPVAEIECTFVYLILLDGLRGRLFVVPPCGDVIRFRDAASLRISNDVVEAAYERANDAVRHIVDSSFDEMIAHCVTTKRIRRWRRRELV